MCPVEYTMTFIEPGELEIKHLHGITFADTYAEAMEKIEDYYGEGIVDIKIMMLEECSVYDFEMNDGENLFNITCKEN